MRMCLFALSLYTFWGNFQSAVQFSNIIRLNDVETPGLRIKNVHQVESLLSGRRIGALWHRYRRRRLESTPAREPGRIIKFRSHEDFGILFQSGRRELNPGPLAPHASALAGLRHAPSGKHRARMRPTQPCLATLVAKPVDGSLMLPQLVVARSHPGKAVL